MILTCCNNLVCANCSLVYSHSSPICPNCLGKISSAKPSLLTISICNSAQIKCKFNCGEILACDKYEQHETYCSLNTDALILCGKCNLPFKKNFIEQHDCLTELINIKEELKKKVDLYESEDHKFIIEKIITSLKLHKHPLILSNAKDECSCDYCNDPVNEDESYNCFICDVICCVECFEKCTGEEYIKL